MINRRCVALLAVVAIVARQAPAQVQPQADAWLAPAQVENLVLLGKVWGFAKYHHPAITRGGVDWDSAMFAVLPQVLEARNSAGAAAALASWLDALDTTTCSPCASLPSELHLAPRVDWIRDERALGALLSARLTRIHQNRNRQSGQRYVELTPNIRNPVFKNEAAYPALLPAAEVRLLALYRFWNIVEYWFPYRDLIAEDWDGLLREFVPRLWSANTEDEYRLQMMQLIARVHDTHANLWSSLNVRPPRGQHWLPVVVRFIEGKAVVTGFSNDTLARASGLRVGDVIQTLGGARIDSLVKAWTPFYAASNEPTRLRDMARALTQGPAGPVRVTGERAGAPFSIEMERVPISWPNVRASMTHDRPGPAFQLLTPDVAYIKLSALEAANPKEYIEQAIGAKVLVIDVRNYPTAFTVFSLGGHLVPRQTPFATFTTPIADNPGAFEFTISLSLRPLTPRFEGAVVILVDEVTQSSAEYHTMAFRTAPNAIVVGSTTAGADGNVSAIPLPGGLRSMISGIGVFYPDRKPTQRVGIIPDLVVLPTVAGVRAGRDEVLEAGVSRALGREFRLPSQPQP